MIISDRTPLENYQRYEMILKAYEIDAESISAFQSQIKKVSIEEANLLGLELLTKLSDTSFDEQSGLLEIETLIKNGANLSYTPTLDSEFASFTDASFPLMETVKNNLPKCLLLLIRGGANLDQVDNQKRSALMQSAYLGNEDTLVFLILAKANVNLRDRYGNTALMLARSQNRERCFDMLLSHGAYLDNQNINGETIETISVQGYPFDMGIDFHNTLKEEAKKISQEDVKALLLKAKRDLLTYCDTKTIDPSIDETENDDYDSSQKRLLLMADHLIDSL